MGNRGPASRPHSRGAGLRQAEAHGAWPERFCGRQVASVGAGGTWLEVSGTFVHN
jgi:hypothetical protein